MKRKFTTFLLVFVCVCFSSICRSQGKFDNALLWKISGKDLLEPSYILGTHHLIEKDFLNEVSGFEEAFNSVDKVVGEMVLFPELMTEMQEKMLQAAMMSEDESYKKILSPEDYKKLDEGLISLFKTGLNDFGVYKPGMISTLVSISMYSAVDPNFNTENHEAIDLYIQNIARDAGRSIYGLETIEDQLYALFDYEPLKDQAESLICSLENIELGKKMLIDLNTYYREKSLEKIYKLAFDENDPCPMSQAQQAALNTDRNRRWMEKIPGMMHDLPSLIVVGALHLVGENGLLVQLDKIGYIVEPIN